ILLYKSLGAWLSLLLAFSIAYFSEMAFLRFCRGTPIGGEDALRLLFVFGLGAVYGVVFLHLGIFISTITMQTRNAVVIALLAWAAIVLVLPNAAALLAKVFAPTPSYNQFNARLDEARNQILQTERRTGADRNPLPELSLSVKSLLH